jgi:hypothetical protein
MGKSTHDRSLTRLLKQIPAQDVPQLHASVLLLIGLAIAEAYNILPLGTLATLLTADQPLCIRLKEAGQALNDRCQSLFPESWLESMPGPTDADARRMDQSLRAIATALTALMDDDNAQPIDPSWLGQAHELLLGHPAPLGQPVLSAQHLPGQHLPAQHQRTQPFSGAFPISGRKCQGAYYTPLAVVEYMVEQTLHPLIAKGIHSSTVLDPACGGGMFLLAAYRYLLDAQATREGRSPTRDDRIEILRASIYGVDLDGHAIQVARVALMLECLRQSASFGDSVENSVALQDSLLHQEIHRVLQHNLQQGNALIADDPPGFGWDTAFPHIMAGGGFDVVLGNPPYLDSERMADWMPHWRQYCSQHYVTAQGNWDLFCVFIEQALTLCKPGGYHSFIVPNKVASAPYAAAVRSLLGCQSSLQSIRDYSQASVFPASVYPLVYVVQRRSPTGSTSPIESPHEDDALILYEHMGETLDTVACTSWLPVRQFAAPQVGWLLTHETARSDIVLGLMERFEPLESLAEVHGAASVSEAYALKPWIYDHLSIADRETHQNSASRWAIAPDHLADQSAVTQPVQLWEKVFADYAADFSGLFPLINSGTIDRYHILWGVKPLKYLGDRYSHPVVRGHDLSAHFPRRYAQAIAPKIIVAGMTKRLECVADPQGILLAGKSTSIIRPHRLPLFYLLGLLNSTLMHRVMSQQFGSNSLQGGYLRVGPPQLKTLPIALPSIELGHRLVQLVKRRMTLQYGAGCEASSSSMPGFSDRSSIASSLQAVENQIDETVCQLYRLSDTEIREMKSCGDREEPAAREQW